MMDFSVIYYGLCSHVMLLVVTVGVIQGSNNLKCYDVECNDIDCLEIAIETRAILPTCTATGDDSCFIEMEQTDRYTFTKAGCGPCENKVFVTTGTTKNEKATSRELQTIDDRTSEITMEMTTVPGKSTTGGLHWFTRKRRAISKKVTKDCCNEDYCNRNNPCGRFTCSAGAPGFTIFLILVTVATCFYYFYC